MSNNSCVLETKPVAVIELTLAAISIVSSVISIVLCIRVALKLEPFVFVLNRAVADLVLSLAIGTTSICTLTTTAVLSNIWQCINPITWFVLIHVHLLLSITRLIAIKSVHRFKQLFTRRTCLLLCGLSWIIPAAVCLLLYPLLDVSTSNQILWYVTLISILPIVISTCLTSIHLCQRRIRPMTTSTIAVTQVQIHPNMTTRGDNYRNNQNKSTLTVAGLLVQMVLIGITHVLLFPGLVCEHPSIRLSSSLMQLVAVVVANQLLNLIMSQPIRDQIMCYRTLRVQ